MSQYFSSTFITESHKDLSGLQRKEVPMLTGPVITKDIIKEMIQRLLA